MGQVSSLKEVTDCVESDFRKQVKQNNMEKIFALKLSLLGLGTTLKSNPSPALSPSKDTFVCGFRTLPEMN